MSGPTRPSGDRLAATAWEDLVATALVGTERRPVAPALLAEVEDLLGAAVPAAAAEQQVLVAAGVLAAWRQAGWTAPSGALQVPPAAADDDRPTASATALQVLELLLAGHVEVTGDRTALVAEWLGRCAAGGWRLPPGVLPTVLQAATSARRARAAAVAAGGPRLRWLARRNPAWAWAREPEADPAALWAAGERDARLAALTALRRSDPARARALLAGTWAGEPAADRARFVAAMAAGLSPADEPFLEAALDDRSKAVRAAAAALLAALPASALADRMRARLRPLVTVGGRLRKRIELTLPGEPDPLAQRDGIRLDGAPPGLGPRAWVLVQLVGSTPLAFWEAHLGAPPEELVRLGAAHEELLFGWTTAATRQGDPAWGRPLLQRRPDAGLLAALPAPAAHDALEDLLPHVPDRGLQPLLAAAAAPWPARTSTAVLDRLRAVDKVHDLVLALPAVAAALGPAASPEVARWADGLRPDDPRSRHVRTLAATTSIRLTIAQELA